MALPTSALHPNARRLPKALPVDEHGPRNKQRTEVNLKQRDTDTPGPTRGESPETTLEGSPENAQRGPRGVPRPGCPRGVPPGSPWVTPLGKPRRSTPDHPGVSPLGFREVPPQVPPSYPPGYPLGLRGSPRAGIPKLTYLLDRSHITTSTPKPTATRPN